MILLEFKTKTGDLYTVNVVDQKLKKTPAVYQEEPPTWEPYIELQDGEVGERLTIHYSRLRSTETAPIAEITFIEA